MAVVVGIAGGSASGKTTLCTRLLERLDGGRAVRLSHDAYYRDLSHLPPAERERHNFDHPEALDNDLLVTHLRDLRTGRPVRVPVYDFRTHTRTGEEEVIPPAPVVLLEGVLVLALPEVRSAMDLRVFVHTDPIERLRRRITRDAVERGRAREAIIAQWETSVVPMHRAFVEPSIRYADVVIPHGGFDPAGVDRVVERLSELMGDS